MPVKAIVTGILLIIMVFFLVNFIEYFLPLSVKADLDMLCRSTLLKMENDGELSSSDKQTLQLGLAENGLTDIVITATPGTKQGGMLTLHVEGDYTYSKTTALFRREDVSVRMVYDKSTMSRKVVN